MGPVATTAPYANSGPYPTGEYAAGMHSVLGIDFGTSNTAAVLRTPDGRVRSLMFDGSPLLPSAVFAPASGPLVVGRDALHHGRFTPGALDQNPKRRVDEGQVLLGTRELAVVDLVAAALRRVGDEAGPADATVLTHPAGWGPVRRLVLTDAARAAGLGEVGLVAEPVAAAHHFVEVLGHEVPPGRALVVYDFGAGTFDVSIVRSGPRGLDVVSFDGLNVGGLDVDAAVVEWIGRRYGGRDAAAWARLTGPRDPEDLRQRHQLWEDVRIAKEMLSRAPSVPLRVPLLGLDAPLTRPDFEEAVQPLVARTVRATADLVRSARLSPGELAGLVLVGGSSRIPLVATALHRELGLPATVTEQPELVVAEGSLYAAVPVPRPVSPPPLNLPRPVSPPPVLLDPVPPAPERRRRPLVWLVAALAVLVLLLGAGTVWQLTRSGSAAAATSTGRPAPEAAGAGSAPADPRSASPSASPASSPPATPGRPTTGTTTRPTKSSTPTPKAFKVPRVLGMHEAEARQALHAAGFPHVAVEYYYNPGLTPGYVIDQVPGDGTYTSPDVTVMITVTIPNPSPSP